MKTPTSKKIPPSAFDKADLALNTGHYNRPGLPALDYRLGRHDGFLRRMVSRISFQELPEVEGKTVRPLRPLTARDGDDPAIALLDAWASVAEVLTFYQERIANEGFLRTAKERRSVLELVRSLTYELKPGVAASTYLVFTVEDIPGTTGRARVPEGVQILSIPGQDEKPQTFETVEELEARAEWNLFKPQTRTLTGKIEPGAKEIYLKGVTTGLRPGDPILLVGKDRESSPGSEHWDFRILREVKTNPEKSFTTVRFDEKLGHERVHWLETGINPKIYSLRLRTYLFGNNAPLWGDLPLDAKREFVVENRGVLDVSLSPDRQQALSGGADATLTLWDLEGKQSVGNYYGHGKAVTCVAFVTDTQGRLLALSGSDDGTLKLWDLPSGETLHTFEMSHLEKGVKCLAVTPDGKRMISGHNDGKLSLWDLENYNWLYTFIAGGGPINDVAIRNDGSMALSGCEDMTLKLWKLDDDQIDLLHTYWDSRISGSKPTGHEVAVTTVAFSPKGDLVVSGGADDLVKLWHIDLKKRDSPISYRGHGGPINSLDVVEAMVMEPLGEVSKLLALSASSDKTLKVWELKDIWGENGELDQEEVSQLVKERRSLHGHTDGVSSVVISEDKAEALSGGDDGSLKLWDWNPLPAGANKVLSLGKTSRLDQVLEWPDFTIRENQIDLDATYPKIFPDSWVVLAESSYVELYQALGVSEEVRSGFTISGNVTRIETDTEENIRRFPLRTTSVFAQSEQLEMASVDVPVTGPVEGSKIVLDRFVPNLSTGQPLIFTGKRMQARVADGIDELFLFSADRTQKVKVKSGDLLEVLKPPVENENGAYDWHLRERNGFSGFLTAPEDHINLHPAAEKGEPVSEVAFLLSTEDHQEETELFLQSPLKNLYDRSTLSIQANVARATHGKTVTEVLGSGDGTKKNQRFTLLEPPLTFVPASTPTGGKSTLELRANGALWEETPSLFGLESGEEKFIVRIDNESKATITFGDGTSGAGLPTGQENVEAVYRTGIGFVGQVAANSLELLKTKPLGIRSVTNPLPASGAADPETMAEAREKAPLSVLTMERIVSRQDFEDFARGFPGIGKAQAKELQDGETRLLHLTVAAVDGGEVAAGSELAIVLGKAIDGVREPLQKVSIDSYLLFPFELEASVLVDPRFETDLVLTKVENALKKAFSFQMRSFGQAVTMSEVISVIQSVPEVMATDINQLHRLSGAVNNSGPTARLPATTAHLIEGGICPAELLLLDPHGIKLTEMKA